MKKADREKFDVWYETTEGKTFNFKQEMYKYCKSDVDILRRGCMKFRELFIQIAGGSALFRQAVFQYGTIPPTRLFNYQVLILVYKQMFTSFALLPIC